MMKKTWTAPVVEELSISATLGGTVTKFYETTLNDLGGTQTNFGTIPGTNIK
ncbi:hypothetical protein [Aquidulcibacter sp.]|uniref:hypothetical protein n=1 Tax=Aquidulcibacter sp. TaxID=2052990 RepID=UPI0025C68129|nr:hypothetical protein [Aquidulcibacter sp.]MCA3693477.1 hypothetical protein [Aquidulcibacter sp.]